MNKTNEQGHNIQTTISRITRACHLASLSRGMQVGAYTAAGVSVAHAVDLSTGQIGLLASTHMLGMVLGPQITRLSPGTGLREWHRLGIVMLMISTAILAMAHQASMGLTLALIAAFVGGAGNNLSNSTSSMSLANQGSNVVNQTWAFWTAGAILSVAASKLFTAMQEPAHMVFLISTLTAIAAFISAGYLQKEPMKQNRAQATQTISSHSFIMAACMAMFLESTSSLGLAAQLQIMTGTPALIAIMGHWCGLLSSRVTAGKISERVGERQMMTIFSSLAIVGLLLCGLPQTAVIGYILTGIGLGPLFPTSLTRAARAHGRPAIPGILTMAMMGGAVGPLMLSQLSGATSSQIAGPVLALIGIGMLINLRMQPSQRELITMLSHAAPTAPGTQAQPAS